MTIRYHILIRKDGHRWCFAYTPENAGRLLKRLVDYLHDPECDFDLNDLCSVAWRVVRDVEDDLHKLTR